MQQGLVTEVAEALEATKYQACCIKGFALLLHWIARSTEVEIRIRKKFHVSAFRQARDQKIEF